MVASDCREMAFGGPSCPFQFYIDLVVHKLRSEKTWDRKGSLSDKGLARSWEAGIGHMWVKWKACILTGTVISCCNNLWRDVAGCLSQKAVHYQWSLLNKIVLLGQAVSWGCVPSLWIFTWCYPNYCFCQEVSIQRLSPFFLTSTNTRNIFFRKFQRWTTCNSSSLFTCHQKQWNTLKRGRLIHMVLYRLQGTDEVYKCILHRK